MKSNKVQKKIKIDKEISTHKKLLKKTYTLISGASSGIGEQTAYLLAEKSENLILIARRTRKLKAIQKKCLSLGALSVEIFQCDLTRVSDIKKLESKFRDQKISISKLINNAGLAKGVELVHKADTQDWDAMIDTNVKGLLHLSRIVLDSIIKNQGHIINIGSVAGRIVYEGGAVYCATKFAVRALNDGFRMDLKGTGVRVTNIEPGMVNTEFSLVRLGSKQKAEAVYEDMMPLSPIDIAKTILWCLDQPAHVNIQELVIYPTDQASVGQVVRGEKSIKNLKNKI